jgi:hypothetical protein
MTTSATRRLVPDHNPTFFFFAGGDLIAYILRLLHSLSVVKPRIISARLIERGNSAAVVDLAFLGNI